MKKLWCILLIVSLFAITGCSSVQNAPESAATDSATAAAEESTSARFTPDKNAVYEYETREIWCENNGNRIYGEAYTPVVEGVEKFPLVIHAHGMGSNHEAGEAYCKRYAEKGFAGYSFDFPGGSRPTTENKSDGDQMKMTPVTEAADLQAVLDTALTWDFVDTDRVFLEGGSQGGLEAAMVGLDNTDKVKGMILHYPALYMPQIITSWYDDPDSIPDTISFGEDYELSGQFARDLYDVDVVSRLGDFPGNVIIIQGSEDTLVPAYYSEEASTLFPNCEYYVIEGSGHGFGGEDFETAVNYGLEYLYKNT